MAVKIPCSVGSRVSATWLTWLSVRRRNLIRSAMEIILKPCVSANSRSCGPRAMDPSSLTISQMTPAGVSPARRARSTAASVCPGRTSTPPSR